MIVTFSERGDGQNCSYFFPFFKFKKLVFFRIIFVLIVIIIFPTIKNG